MCNSSHFFHPKHRLRHTRNRARANPHASTRKRPISARLKLPRVFDAPPVRLTNVCDKSVSDVGAVELNASHAVEHAASGVNPLRFIVGAMGAAEKRWWEKTMCLERRMWDAAVSTACIRICSGEASGDRPPRRESASSLQGQLGQLALRRNYCRFQSIRQMKPHPPFYLRKKMYHGSLNPISTISRRWMVDKVQKVTRIPAVMPYIMPCFPWFGPIFYHIYSFG